jgi:hypothetical protein
MHNENLSNFPKKVNTGSIFGTVESVSLSSVVLDSFGQKFSIQIETSQIPVFESAKRKNAQIVVGCEIHSCSVPLGGIAFFRNEFLAKSIDFVEFSESLNLVA